MAASVFFPHLNVEFLFFFHILRSEKLEECGIFCEPGKISVKNQGNRSRNMQKYEKEPENSKIFRLRRAKENKRTRKH